MNDSHLLNERALATFTGAQQQQLEFPAGVLLVPPQLPLDLGVDPLGLLVLVGQAAARHGGANTPLAAAVAAVAVATHTLARPTQWGEETTLTPPPLYSHRAPGAQHGHAMEQHKYKLWFYFSSSFSLSKQNKVIFG